MNILKERALEIILASTIHGIPSFFRTRRTCFKCIWLLGFVINAGLCGFLLFKAITAYYNHEIVTTTTVVSEIPIDFPKVTICNKNPLMTNASLKFVHDVLNEMNITNGPKYVEANTYETLFNLSGSAASIRLFRLLVVAKSQNKELSDDFRKSLGLSIHNLLISCVFASSPCSPDDFSWYYDGAYGNCFVFNKFNNTFFFYIPFI